MRVFLFLLVLSLLVSFTVVILQAIYQLKTNVCTQIRISTAVITFV